MIDLDVVEAELRKSVRGAWVSYSGHTPIAAEFCPLNAYPRLLRACIRIGAAWEGALCLESSESLARRLNDAWGKVANMLSSSVKQALPPPGSVSLPIVESMDINQAAFSNRRLSAGFGFSCWEEPFRIGFLSIREAL